VAVNENKVCVGNKQIGIRKTPPLVKLNPFISQQGIARHKKVDVIVPERKLLALLFLASFLGVPFSNSVDGLRSKVKKGCLAPWHSSVC